MRNAEYKGWVSSAELEIDSRLSIPHSPFRIPH
jgi:hypothetical protein